MNGAAGVTTLVAALGCGLVAGVFFAFSSFVMPAFGRLPDEQGVLTMQEINRTAVTPVFMTAVFGTAALCLGLAVWAGTSLGDRRAPWVLAASGLYLVGTIGVTIAGNVPLNDKLDKVKAGTAEAADVWSDFLSRWNALNHVRGVAALAAAALLTIALVKDA